MNQRILITGGSGLLGSYLARWLRHKGYINITATYHHSKENIPADIRDGITWVPLSLPDKQACYAITEGQDWVIHAAGYVSYHPKDKYALLDTNKAGTEHMVNACLHHGISHFVYISSISTLGRESHQAILDENSPWVENEFSTSYGLSKYLGELESWRAAAEGLNVTAILPSVILGTGDWNRSSLQMLKRIVSSPGYYPSGQTGFVDVRDITSFITLVLEKSLSGERWLLSGGDLTYGAMYTLVAQHMGLNKTFRVAPKWLANLILKGSNLIKKNGLGTEILRQSYGSYAFDASKSLTVDGFQYRPIEASVEEIAQHFRSQTMDLPLHF